MAKTKNGDILVIKKPRLLKQVEYPTSEYGGLLKDLWHNLSTLGLEETAKRHVKTLRWEKSGSGFLGYLLGSGATLLTLFITLELGPPLLDFIPFLWRPELPLMGIIVWIILSLLIGKYNSK